jgi:hypothetical protein
MIKFKVFTEKCPQTVQYFSDLQDNLKEAVYYKGNLVIEDLVSSLEVTLEFENYIPKTFLVMASLPIASSVVLYFMGYPWAGLAAFIPGLIMLLVYWLFQSNLFFFYTILFGLRKAGYRGKTTYREGK